MKSESRENYAIILRVTRIIGSSSLLSMFFNMLRMKAAAVLIGPAGVGFVGLLQSFVLLASSIIGAGVNQSAARQVAESAATAEEEKERVTQTAIFSLALLLVAVGSLILFIFRDLIEPLIVVSSQYKFEYFWLVLAIAAVTFSGIFNGQLSGYRRIKDIALVNIISAAASLCVGFLSLFFLEENGFLIFFISFFVIRFLITSFFLKNVYLKSKLSISIAAIFHEYRALLRIGVAIMVGSVAWNAAHIIAKKFVEQEVSLEEVGILEAGWTLGTVYLGFLLASISADYLPRLTAVINSREKAVEVINHQTEMIFLFAGPVVIFTMGFSPWIVPFLYSSEFQEASELLKLFVLGDVLKLLTWPLTYALIALGRSSNFLFVELISVFAYVMVILLFVDTMGASAAGLSIVIIYSLTLPICYFFLKIQLSFRWSRYAIKIFGITFALVLSVYLIGIYSISWAAACSAVFSLSASAYSFFTIRSRMNGGVTDFK